MWLAQIATSQQTGNTIGGSAFAAFIAHFMGILPVMTGTIAAIGGVLGIVWYSIMIFESDTMKYWRVQRHARRRLRRVQWLKGELQVLAAELASLEPKMPADHLAIEAVQHAIKPAVMEHLEASAPTPAEAIAGHDRTQEPGPRSDAS